MLINGEKLPNAAYFVVGGMGGSRLPAEFFRAMFPRAFRANMEKLWFAARRAERRALYRKFVFRKYKRDTFIFDEARARNMKCAVIAGGGELLLRARAAGVPHIQIPWEEATPARRMLPAALRALSLMVMGKDDSICEGFAAAERVGAYERGMRFSGNVPAGSIPMFLRLREIAVIAEYAKIETSETAHIHAFASVFPEFLHNELAGFASENTHITPVFFLTHRMMSARQKTRATLCVFWKRGDTRQFLLILQKEKEAMFWQRRAYLRKASLMPSPATACQPTTSCASFAGKNSILKIYSNAFVSYHLFLSRNSSYSLSYVINVNKQKKIKIPRGHGIF